METISIKDENGKEYRFEKPEFECELLKIVTESASGCEGIIGYVVSDLDEVVPLSWNLDGRASHLPSYNLALIKPKWYEDEDMIGKCAITTDTNEMFIVKSLISDGCVGIDRELQNHTYHWCDVKRCRPVTKEEVLSLFYQGKEK